MRPVNSAVAYAGAKHYSLTSSVAVVRLASGQKNQSWYDPHFDPPARKKPKLVRPSLWFSASRKNQSRYDPHFENWGCGEPSENYSHFDFSVFNSVTTSEQRCGADIGGIPTPWANRVVRQASRGVQHQGASSGKVTASKGGKDTGSSSRTVRQNVLKEMALSFPGTPDFPECFRRLPCRWQTQEPPPCRSRPGAARLYGFHRKPPRLHGPFG